MLFLQVICTGKIGHTGISSYIPQYEYLKSITPKEQWGQIKMSESSYFKAPIVLGQLLILYSSLCTALAAPNCYHLRYSKRHLEVFEYFEAPANPESS